jgi:hypothetical protein
MRGSGHYLRGLTWLHELDSDDERRAAWRQSMATLAEATAEARGVPLEGLRPEPLLASVRAAMAAGLVDDLGFLAPAAAACALYGLASALPHGPERRELGRRVLVRLHEGDATTFVSLATAVALGSTRAFEGPAMRARVSLALALPIGIGAPVDALALALISRHELAQRWLVEPSTGSLPARRMAARLLERAAREAARRAVQGDDGAVFLFDSPVVQTAWTHLMNDREPLVWRHVATGRGLLSAVVPRFAEEVERDLLAAQSLARGRRGAASLAARVAIRPSEAVAQARDLLFGSALGRDPGMAAAMVYGLPRAAEVEPDAAEDLLSAAVEQGGVLAAEALLDLRREWYGTSFGLAAAEKARSQLRQRFAHGSDDDGHAALIDLLCQDLGESEPRATPLPEAVFQALTAFADTSARTACDLARTALALAEDSVARLAVLDESRGPEARREAFRILQELDLALLETSTLPDLLGLGLSGQEATRPQSPLGPLFVRLEAALMRHERNPYAGGETVPHLTLRMRRLRTLLHLLDGDSHRDERAPESHEGRLEAVRLLFDRVAHDAPSAMDRIVHAAMARGCDGLVRDEVFELSDVVLAAASHVPTPEGFATLSEGSMMPEVKLCTKALASLVRTLYKVKPDSLGQRALIEALTDLSRALPTDSSPRTEGLRSSLLRLSRALRHIASARSLTALAQERRPIELLEHAVDELVQLSAGARRRLGVPGAEGAPTSGHGVWALGIAIERAATDDSRAGLELALETLADSLRAELPPIFASVTLRILRPLLERPREGALLSAPPSVVPDLMEDRPLPAWLPRARVLGGFYVLRMLGSGSGGSVFVVRRLEERNDPLAPELALKVPEYDGSAARALSEEEFFRLFRAEAGSLLAVPPHENLAGFVTFDASVRPKPILVMELVKGPTLERVLAKGELDTGRALTVLGGVLAGLECMHAVGVGHLGVKPSNVVLREREPGLLVPVLVDYGLSGRHVRPGCAAGPYGAPEIWRNGRGDLVEAAAADVYAFGCLAFELLTGQLLFDGHTEALVVAEHLSHDGRPYRLVSLAQDPATLAVAEWISGCLRREPGERSTVAQLKRELPAVRAAIVERAWPLAVSLDTTL